MTAAADGDCRRFDQILLRAFVYFVELVGDEPVRLAVNAG
jgi:hypothetical protein